jgi:hypothetical protein
MTSKQIYIFDIKTKNSLINFIRLVCNYYSDQSSNFQINWFFIKQFQHISHELFWVAQIIWKYSSHDNKLVLKLRVSY